MKSLSIILCLSLGMLFLFSACEDPIEEDTRRIYIKPIDPNIQKNELSEALLIDGLNKAGEMAQDPASNDIQILSSQPTASVTNDNVLFIPLIFSSNTMIVEAQLQIVGAENFWQIPIAPSGNDYTLQVGIPANISNGDFEVQYRLKDGNGNLSAPLNLEVNVAAPISQCNGGWFPRTEGNDGVTVRTYYLEGEEAQEISISYYMYVVPDRIDVRYGNEWVGSSGNLLSKGDPVVFKRCDQVIAGDGFSGGGGTITVNFDPAISRRIDVYVSGCLDGGTAWYFDVSCPNGAGGGVVPQLCEDPSIVTNYDQTSDQYHIYPEEGADDIKTLICDGNINSECRRRFVFETMQESVSHNAPTELTSKINNCSAFLVDMEMFGFTSPFYKNNPIRTVITPSQYKITNFTLKDYRGADGIKRTHVLHPGRVDRTIVVEDKKVYVVTTGEGTGAFGSMNVFFANSLWTDVDEVLKAAPSVGILL